MEKKKKRKRAQRKEGKWEEKWFWIKEEVYNKSKEGVEREGGRKKSKQ
jgi:hypothetical protein